MNENPIIQRAAECLHTEAAAITALQERLDEHFLQAVEMIRACKGKVVVTGVGKSGHIGSKIAATLASTGTPAFFLNPLDAYHGDPQPKSCCDSCRSFRRKEYKSSACRPTKKVSSPNTPRYI